MDKRLEEIKENAIKEKTHIKHIETGESRWGHTYTLMDTDFNWLISTVEEQQKEIEALTGHYHNAERQKNKSDDDRIKLKQENARLREAYSKMLKTFQDNYELRPNEYDGGYLDGLERAIGIIEEALEESE